MLNPLKTGTLIKQLTALIVALDPLIERIRQAIKLKKDIRETLDLHAATLDSIQTQLKIVENILDSMQRSFRIIVVIGLILGMLSVFAFVRTL